MKKTYGEIVDVVRADLEKVKNILRIEFNINKPIANELTSYLDGSSKMLRSLVAILYLRATKIYLLPEHYELFAITELVHNASLIHDDVIDNSTQRRSHKTLNEKFDNKLAVVAGDYLLAIALEKLAKIGNTQLISIFSDIMKNMCKGEIEQYFDKFKKIKLAKYLTKTEAKTASLFEGTIAGAILLSNESDLQRAGHFAKNFGIAFQIRDDLINVLKSDKSKDSDDFENGIYTAPYILANNLDDGIKKTKQLLNNYTDICDYCIKDFEESIYKDALYSLLELIKYE